MHSITPLCCAAQVPTPGATFLHTSLGNSTNQQFNTFLLFSTIFTYFSTTFAYWLQISLVSLSWQYTCGCWISHYDWLKAKPKTILSVLYVLSVFLLIWLNWKVSGAVNFWKVFMWTLRKLVPTASDIFPLRWNLSSRQSPQLTGQTGKPEIRLDYI